MLFFFLANIINNWIQFIDTDNNRILFSSSIVCWKCMVCLRVECLWAEACQWSTTAIVAKTPFGQLCKRKFRLCVNFIAFFFNVYYVASSLLFYCKILLTCVRVAAIRQPSAHIQKLKTKRQTLAQREREREATVNKFNIIVWKEEANNMIKSRDLANYPANAGPRASG